MTDSKIDQQMALEKKSVVDGIVRYRNAAEKKDLCDLSPGKALLSRTIQRVVDGVEHEKANTHRARRGRPSVYGQYMNEFDADVLAFTTARVVINALVATTPAKFNGLAIRVGTSLQEALLYKELKPLEPSLFNTMERKAKKATTTRHSRAVMNKAARVTMEKHGTVTGLAWSEREKMILGAKLIEIFIETTGLARVGMSRRGRKTTQVVLPTPETIEWIDKQHGRCELLTPMHLPMIVPPKPWKQPIGGGYLGGAGGPSVPMIKTRDRDTIDEYFSMDMPEVYSAINAIQNTAWRVNHKVLDVLSELAKSETSVAGLPASAESLIPDRPADIDTNEQARKEWRINAARAHGENSRNSSKRIGLSQQLYVADLMKEEPEIFFPHNLCFRGRLYPIPQGLNPQANDTGKALLEFAEGKPLGETGAYWLAVHIANLYGFDKAALDDRVQWVVDNERAILDSAMEPLDGQMFWAGADKPFCFLAACFEWLGQSFNGEDHISHIPVAMDGSCSGLQHYSALLRDSLGGAAVNLMPAEKPVDIYTTVADAVEKALLCADPSDKLAMAWGGKVVRKIVKQPCMTYAYSATARGMRDQVMDAMRKMDPSGNYLAGYSEFEAAMYLAPIVRNCIRETVIAASTAMDWLQDAIKALNKQQLPCIWTTPVGLPVIQREMAYKGKRVEILFDGRRVVLSYAVVTKKLNTRKQISGIAPNYIHSLDASHLMKTVNACVGLAAATPEAEQGAFSFAMVHDSFGTHPCDVDDMNATIRSTFVDMYSHSWLEDFKASAERLLEKELPPIPAMGDLDLTAVEESDFFFA